MDAVRRSEAHRDDEREGARRGMGRVIAFARERAARDEVEVREATGLVDRELAAE